MNLKKLMSRKYLYHKAPISFRESILRKGLIPKVGASYSLHWEGEVDINDLIPYVFLYDHDTIDNGEYDSTYDDDIYRIDTKYLDESHLFADPDENMKGCFAYDKPISPQAIELVYEGSENDSWGDMDKHSYIYQK